MVTARDRLSEPDPTKESLVEFTAVLQGLLDDLFELSPEGLGDYSTTEVETGNEWVDGKAVYRQVYSGTTGSGASTSVASGTVFDTVITCKIRLNDTSDNHIGTDSQNYASIPLDISIDSSNNFIINHNDATLQNQNYFIIVEYTK